MTPRPARSIVRAIAVAMAAAPLASCDRRAQPPAPGDQALPMAIEVADGPLKATVARAADAIEVADPLIVDLIAEAPTRYDVTLPADAALAPFEVLSRTRPDRVVLAGDLATTRVRLTITSDRAGELELPALTFTFVPAATEATEAGGATPDGAASGTTPAHQPIDDGPAVLSTPPIPVSVVSLLPEGDDDPTAFIGNKPAAARPDERARRPIVLAVAVAALLLAAATTAGIVVRRRRRTPPPTPVQWANAELDRLAADGMSARGEVEPFFVRLTGIAREFIRRRLGIAAPMRTSNEFLRDLGGDHRLAPSQQALLDRLLRFGDLVKFAREGADGRACDDALDAVRQLVVELGDPAPPAATPHSDGFRPQASPTPDS